LGALNKNEGEEIEYYEIKDPSLRTTFLKIGIFVGDGSKRSRFSTPNHGMDFGNPSLVTLQDTLNDYFVLNL